MSKSKNRRNRKNRQIRANAAKRSSQVRSTVDGIDVVKEEVTNSTLLVDDVDSKSNVISIEERRSTKLSIVKDDESASNDGSSGEDGQLGVDHDEARKAVLTAVSDDNGDLDSDAVTEEESDSDSTEEDDFIETVINKAIADFDNDVDEDSGMGFGDPVSDEEDADTGSEDEDEDDGDKVRSIHASNDEYFDDDEAVLAGDDKVLHSEDDLTIISQGENIVTCEIVNLYKDNGKLKGKYSIRADPPIFQIEDNSGSYASFVVTQELARTLERNFGDIRKVYSGLDPSVKVNPLSQESLRKKYDNSTEWVTENKIKAGLIALVILLVIVSQLL